MLLGFGAVVAFESGRRLCILVEAGATRFAVEATSVTEVATATSDRDSLRGALEVKDLSQLLGGDPVEEAGMIIVLDVSPTLAVRVRSVVEVADLAQAPFFLLPPGLGPVLGRVSRGAVLHRDRLYLELVAEALAGGQPRTASAPARPVHLAQDTPERSLVFESQGRLFGVPLPLVSQVVNRSDAFSALPASGGPVAGIFPHAQALWPICSAPGLLGGEALAEAYFVLTQPAGQSIGWCASRVLGVYPRFEPGEAAGEFRASALSEPVLFLDLQRMFS